MADASPTTNGTPPTRPQRSMRGKLLLGGLVVLAIAIAAFFGLRRNPLEERAGGDANGNDTSAKPTRETSAWEALVQASPYRNVHPDVRYVSDAACAECHGEISEAYATHPMGRSLAPAAKAEPIEQLTSEARHPLEVDGLIYRIRKDGNRQFHQETRLSPAGAESLSIEHEAVYAVGSGRTGRSYVIERDKHLFMSPLTWYADHGWDLSPGYEVNNSHFNRPVVSECLFCHANRADHVEGTLNEYRPPIFAGHAIGCQRCHGPGELHVAAQERGDVTSERDTTIVNPAHLTPDLRESVCQQCHLGGLVRVEARGRKREDFRPGLPWSAVEPVYLAARQDLPERVGGSETARTGDNRPAAEAGGEQPDRFVGHVEQMHQSGCYVGSGGKLGCISCHDPHRLPAESDTVEFYRARCLQCHGEADCHVALAERRQRDAGDSCYACHMPQADTQIRHAAVTDHRIPRSADSPPARSPAQPSPAWSPLVAFRSLTILGNGATKAVATGAAGKAGVGGVPGANSAAEEERNLAVALVRGMDRHPDIVDDRVLPRVIAMLDAAVRRDPTDVPARDAYAFALVRNRDYPEALRQMEEVVQRQPRHESALVAAAEMVARAGRLPAAAALWERARDVNPWMARYWTELAFCQKRLGRWNDCTTTCEEALKRFPDSFGARQLLVECRLVAGRTADAEREYGQLLKLNPPKPESIRHWWENHPLRKQPPRGN